MTTTKPWHDAQPGDLWVLTLDGGETRTATVRRRLEDGTAHWIGEGIGTYNLRDHHIVDGTRVYPPQDMAVYDLKATIQGAIYGTYSADGRNAPAETLAANIAHVLGAHYLILPLDPRPWGRYTGEQIDHRAREWDEDHDAFLPRDGYVKDIEAYWGMRPGEQLSLDDSPWTVQGDGGRVLFRTRTRADAEWHYDEVRGGAKGEGVEFSPRRGYNQNRGLYRG